MLIQYTSGQDPTTYRAPTRAPIVLGVGYSLLSIAVVIVSLRIIVKAKLGKLAIEDALIVMATIITATIIVLTSLMVPYGFGRHIHDIQPEWWPIYSKYSYGKVGLACTPYPLTKISMLLFYLRLTRQPTFRKICFTTMGYIGVSSAVVTMLNLFSCTPIRGGWDHSPALNAKCIDASRFYYFNGAMSMVTDILLMTLPIPILLRLQLRKKVKYGLVGMFAAGTLITAISGYSVYSMYAAYHSADGIWDGAYSWMWALVELNLGIIAACMPSMLLFVKWVRGEMTETKGSTGRSRSQNPTIGGGGGGGGGSGSAGKYSRNKPPSQTNARTSHRLGSEEYIMQEMGGIVKTTELVVVEMGVPPGSREGPESNEGHESSEC